MHGNCHIIITLNTQLGEIQRFCCVHVACLSNENALKAINSYSVHGESYRLGQEQSVGFHVWKLAQTSIYRRILLYTQPVWQIFTHLIQNDVASTDTDVINIIMIQNETCM